MDYTKKTAAAFIFIMGLSILLGQPVLAANDDPGKGRLSGNSVSEDFYGETSSSLSLSRYGDALSPYTGQAYQHQPRFLDRTVANGIDISQWQGGKIDWNLVKAAGIDFAFIRVGYRGYGAAGTLSENTKDVYFDKNMQNAYAAGVNTGVYIFSQAITVTEAIEEANYILNHIGNYPVTMPLVMDYEYYSDAGNSGRLFDAKLSKEQATAICLAFCDTIAEAGYTPMIYANQSMLENQLNAADITARGYRTWLANYTTNTTYAGDFDFWQYSSSGKVDGILDSKGKPAAIDMNFYYTRQTDNFLHTVNPLGTAVVSPVPDQLYTGTAITPEVTVTLNGVPLTKDTDYTLSYINNQNVGVATIKIQGINGYAGGARTTAFNILPNNAMELKTKKRATNYITLSWSKDANVTGYEIYRSTAIDGSYKKIVTIKKKSTTSYKNTKLSAGQCYYYKIRSYTTSGGQTYYGAFSSIKAISTKNSCTRKAKADTDIFLLDTANHSGTPIIGIPANAMLPVTYYTKDAEGNGWYYVEYETSTDIYNGFVAADEITITKVGKIQLAKKVNVRKSASVNSKKITTLKRNAKVTILSSKKKKGITWYKVTFKKGGKTYNGWISAAYVKII